MNKFRRDHKPEVLIAVITILLITAFALTPAFRGSGIVDGANAGQFGDFIGGYFGTIFLIISVVLLYGSYREQKATNAKNHVEARFFELLKYHRENVAELGIDDGKFGQRVFVSMIREFRDAWKVVDNADPTYPQAQKLDLAYLAFYYGVGPNSSRILKAAVEKNHSADLVKKVADHLTDIQRQYRVLEEALHAEGVSEESVKFRIRHEWSKTKLSSISYRPFDGHQSRLGHYFRHLYQTAKYIKQHGGEHSTDYAGILRAQLSNHEQALLALNALSDIGKNWRIEKLVVDFALIKNIPNAFFPPEMVNIKETFRGIIFEYELGEHSTESTDRSTTDSINVI